MIPSKMFEALRNNPSLSRYVAWLAGCGLVSLGCAYLLYFSVNNLTAMVLLCQFSLIPTIATTWTCRSAYRTGRRLYLANYLDWPAATFVATEATLVGGVVVVAGILAVIWGTMAGPDYTAKANTWTSLVTSSLGIVCLYFPANVLSLGAGACALIRLRHLPQHRSRSEIPSAAEVESDLRLDTAENGTDFVDIDEVWVSSRQHLDQFNAIIKSAPAGSQALAGFAIPAGYPYTYTTLPWIRTPLLFYARGKLRIGLNELVFRSVNQPKSFAGKQVRLYDLSDDLKLRIRGANIQHMVWFKYESPIASEYNLPWISLATNDQEFLLIAGEFGSISSAAKVRERTRRLYSDLIRLVGRNSPS